MVRLPQAVFDIASGVGDLATTGLLGLADMTILPLADTVQAGLKFLHGSVTGDFQPLTSLSSFSAPNAGTWDGLKSTGTNIFNVSPLGMVYHSYTGARDTTTALMNGDLRQATSIGLGLGLNFAAARGAGMGDYGFTITDVRGSGMGRLSQAGAVGIKFGRFPSKPHEMTSILGVPPKRISLTPDGTTRIVWEPNSQTRIRFESHPDGLKPGDPAFHPRHHGEHYHVEIKPPGLSWNQAKTQGLVVKALPDGYTLGSGTGFLAEEAFPGYHP